MIREELDDKQGIAASYNHLGVLNWYRGDIDKALQYFISSFKIDEKIGNKRGLGYDYNTLGIVDMIKGNYAEALDNFKHFFKIHTEIDDKRGIAYSLTNIGLMYLYNNNNLKAMEHFEKSLIIQKKIGLMEGTLMLETTIFLSLSNKRLGKEYDKNEINCLIKNTQNIDYHSYFILYQLLEDNSYLECAYNQIQQMADNLEHDVAAKFLSYPIPKAIVEEWEKVK